MQGVPELYVNTAGTNSKGNSKSEMSHTLGSNLSINELVAVAVSGICRGIDIFI